MAKWEQMRYLPPVTQSSEYRVTLPDGGTLRVLRNGAGKWDMSVFGRKVSEPVETLEEAQRLCEAKAVECLNRWLAVVTE